MIANSVNQISASREVISSDQPARRNIILPYAQDRETPSAGFSLRGESHQAIHLLLGMLYSTKPPKPWPPQRPPPAPIRARSRSPHLFKSPPPSSGFINRGSPPRTIRESNRIPINPASPHVGHPCAFSLSPIGRLTMRRPNNPNIFTPLWDFPTPNSLPRGQPPCVRIYIPKSFSPSPLYLHALSHQHHYESMPSCPCLISLITSSSQEPLWLHHSI